MIADRPITRKIGLICIVLLGGLIIALFMAVAWGVTGGSLRAIWETLQNGPGAGGAADDFMAHPFAPGADGRRARRHPLVGGACFFKPFCATRLRNLISSASQAGPPSAPC